MKRLKFKNSLSIISLTLLISSCGSRNTFTDPLIPEQQVITQTVQAPQANVNNFDALTVNAVFQGSVVQILPEDTSGLQHEKFMFQISDGLNGQYNGQVVLVAHDISMAPFVPIRTGSQLEIKGDFIPDQTPKVLHWTHLDDKHVHPDGYIKLNGKIYQ